ncbi:MAG: NADH-quinone oxidoreductase subunit N, partial [Chloroflexi bacterium]|nr:NADH-quinone oxidoreductase subunit N [Chloroflexota bacterium]
SRVGSDQIDAFAGMSRRAPVVSAVLALSMISLIGIPPTAGFMGKLYLFNAAVRGDLVWLAVVGVINSVVSAYYYLRVIRVMYMAPGEPGERVPSSIPVRLALAATSLGVLGLGVLPGPLIEVSEAAARSLLPGV